MLYRIKLYLQVSQFTVMRILPFLITSLAATCQYSLTTLAHLRSRCLYLSSAIKLTLLGKVM